MPFPARSLCTTVLAAALLATLPAQAVQPTPLDAQLKRLAGLLGDSYATVYPEATQVQTISGPNGQKLVLALFTIEAYGGGNDQTRIHLVLDRGLSEVPAEAAP